MDNSTSPQQSSSESTLPKPTAPKTTKKSKLAVPLIAGVVLLAGAGAAAFNASVQNTPEKIWEDALSNTAEGFSTFVDDAAQYESKGLTVDGSFNLKSPVAADGKINGQWYEKNAKFESSIGLSGVRIDSDVRAITSEGSDTPDIYVYLDGLQAVQGLLGASQPQLGSIVEQVNGQWIVIDRTLIGQGLEQLEQETNISADEVMLEKKDLEDISRVSAEVINEYVFSSNEDKAVFQVADQLGEEELDSVATYKYAVTINKENLKSFVTAYKDALKETQFDEYVIESSDSEETFEEVIEFDQLLESIDEIDYAKTTNEAWVDLDRRIIRNVRITPTEQDPGTIGYIEFALPYDGGDVLPFTFRVNTGREEASGNEIIAEFVAGYNQSNSSFALSFDIDGTVDDQTIDVTAELSITPSNDEINVEKPTGAINILEIVGQLQGGLGDFTSPSADPFDQFQLDDVEL